MTGCNMNKQNGYTLVETIVALGIFVLIAALGTGIFTSILGAQSKTVSQQDASGQLRFFQDVFSRDIRQAKKVQCNNPDPTTGKSTSLDINLSSSGQDPVSYVFDASQDPKRIIKTQNGESSPLTDIKLQDAGFFCKSLGPSNTYVTVNVLVTGIPSPYQVSITPRSGVLK